MTESADPEAVAWFGPTWTVEELISEGLAALERGQAGDAKRIDGRALAVKASPLNGKSEHIVVGTATLPPGFSTRAHSHAAEEVAVVLRGSGFVDIEGTNHRLDPGTVLLTPANLVHLTHSDAGDEPLVVLWFYAPPGAEARWVEPDKHVTSGPFDGPTAGPTKGAHEMRPMRIREIVQPPFECVPCPLASPGFSPRVEATEAAEDVNAYAGGER